MDYKSAGVDVKAGEQAVKAIKQLVKTSYNNNVLSELGSFGGLYKLDKEKWSEPVLVSSTDGVGTKIRVAIMAEKFDTVGQDLVNHCVNDILVQGAHPQFFLDYIGLSRMEPAKVEMIIGGLVKACRENSCALIGGEMAEMPGIYHDDDFDLVGTIIGVVDKAALLPRNISAGDSVIGFPSTGLHTNGYSLARKIVFEHLNLNVNSYVNECSATVKELLLTIHRSYYKDLQPYLLDKHLHGLAHITGGGIQGNLKRIIPDDLTADLHLARKQIPALFRWLQEAGELSDEVAQEAFNLGIGMIAVCESDLAEEIVAASDAIHLGQIIQRETTALPVTLSH